MLLLVLYILLIRGSLVRVQEEELLIMIKRLYFYSVTVFSFNEELCFVYLNLVFRIFESCLDSYSLLLSRLHFSLEL